MGTGGRDVFKSIYGQSPTWWTVLQIGNCQSAITQSRIVRLYWNLAGCCIRL